MTVLKRSQMATTSEREKKEKEIAAEITRLIAANKPSEAALLACGHSKHTVEAIRKGKNVANYAKLAELATVLKSTPNEILGFPIGENREVVIGLLQGMAIALGKPLEQAVPLADIVAAKLDSPSVRSNHTSPRDSARTLAEDVIAQFFVPKQS